ncbi:MAG TPA: methyltransferase domain-containing protein [Chloroflexota bacterium]
MAFQLGADTAALKARIAVNDRRAEHNLEDWIAAEAQIRPGLAVADLGCGTGKQIFAFAPKLLPDGSILGLDISRAAVDEVNSRARDLGLAHVSAVLGGLDGAPEVLAKAAFDLILSTYAIYYATDVVDLIRKLAAALREGGQLFVSGPGSGTNLEMTDLLAALAPRHAPAPIDDFISEVQIRTASEAYASTSVARLENAVRFGSAEEVLVWWKNHASFRPELEEGVASALQRHFESAPAFEMTKNVLGVHFYR